MYTTREQSQVTDWHYWNFSSDLTSFRVICVQSRWSTSPLQAYESVIRKISQNEVHYDLLSCSSNNSHQCAQLISSRHTVKGGECQQECCFISPNIIKVTFYLHIQLKLEYRQINSVIICSHSCFAEITEGERGTRAAANSA